MDILVDHPVRKTKQQKEAFRQDVRAYLQGLGYRATEEKGSFGARNLIAGDPEGAEFLVTAHYDTCARMLMPNLITPCNLLPFALYQILLSLLILVPAFLGGILVGLLTGNSGLAGVSAYILVWVFIGLMLLGPANRNNANDNTSGVVTVLEIARTLPENQRHKVCFVLFDLEEAGLIGSASYRKAHKQATSKQLVLNLDCVGEGDELLMFPTRALKKDRKRLTGLYAACGYFGSKSLTVREKGFAFYPSDQGQFPWGVGICALKKSRWGLYLGRIHTSRDTQLDQTNVNILRAALTNLICRSAGKKG